METAGLHLIVADREPPRPFWCGPASRILTSTYCGDGTLLANDVLFQPLLQGKAAPFLGLTFPLLLLVLWGEREGGSGVLGPGGS